MCWVVVLQDQGWRAQLHGFNDTHWMMLILSTLDLGVKTQDRFDEVSLPNKPGFFWFGFMERALGFTSGLIVPSSPF